MAVIRYDETHDVIDREQLAALLATGGMGERTKDRVRLKAQVDGAMFVVSAWDGEQLVGFARAISDGVTNAYISTVAVRPDHQRRGIGKELIGRLLAGRDGLTFALHSSVEGRALYKCVRLRGRNGHVPARPAALKKMALAAA